MNNRYRNIAYSLIITFIIILFILWSKDVYEGLTGNLLTELMGIIITVLLVDTLLKKNERSKKSGSNSYALKLGLKVADDILRNFYPKGEFDMRNVRYDFGEHHIVTSNNYFQHGFSFNLSKKHKELFEARIKHDVKDSSFINIESKLEYLRKQHTCLIGLENSITQIINTYKYLDENELLSATLNLQLAIFEYSEMKDFPSGHEHAALLIAEFEIPIAHSACQIWKIITDRCDKKKELLNFRKIKGQIVKEKNKSL